jgi:hypothetical protein
MDTQTTCIDPFLHELSSSGSVHKLYSTHTNWTLPTHTGLYPHTRTHATYTHVHTHWTLPTHTYTCYIHPRAHTLDSTHTHIHTLHTPTCTPTGLYPHTRTHATYTHVHTHWTLPTHTYTRYIHPRAHKLDSTHTHVHTLHTPTCTHCTCILTPHKQTHFQTTSLPQLPHTPALV